MSFKQFLKKQQERLKLDAIFGGATPAQQEFERKLDEAVKVFVFKPDECYECLELKESLAEKQKFLHATGPVFDLEVQRRMLDPKFKRKILRLHTAEARELYHLFGVAPAPQTEPSPESKETQA